MKALATGDIVALRYRIERVLGRGGMGTVYVAEHVALRRKIALKVLDARFAADEMERRFEREARTAARLDHVGCVRVLDHGRTVDSRLFIAMELLDGPTLAQVLLSHGPLELAHAVRIAGELCAALAYAHAAGVLHRDLKPENIVMARRGDTTRVVIIDFGLAQLATDTAITRSGTCMGSPSYVAPERLRGTKCDHRADLYSLGVVLYEMLTGRKPFGEGEAVEVALRQLQEPPPPLGRADVPMALAEIVARALEKAPEARHADALEMGVALARVTLSPPAAAVAPRAMTAVVRALPPPPPARILSTRRLPPAVIVPEGELAPADTRPGPLAAMTLARAETVPALATRTDAIDVARTLAIRLGDGPLWRRALAWWRHGAWRWRTA